VERERERESMCVRISRDIILFKTLASCCCNYDSTKQVDKFGCKAPNTRVMLSCTYVFCLCREIHGLCDFLSGNSGRSIRLLFH
jgi:hypothetical protein